jgi:hypothetical protein
MMAGRPETTAAVVNGLLVLSVPLVSALVGSSVSRHNATSVTVRPPGYPRTTDVVSDLIPIAVVLLPFALLAGWRTHVYAKRWLDRKDRGWRAVAEAGACGLIVALANLAHGIVTRPKEAPPYVIFYGGVALVAGILVGLFLRATAMLVLKRHKPTVA